MNDRNRQDDPLGADYDDVVQELSAAVKPVSLDQADADKLRTRVMERIDDSIASQSGLITVRADSDALWVDLSPTSKKKTLKIDEKNGTELCLLRMEPGTEVGRHHHDVDEICFVLEGDLTIDDLDMTVGDFHFAPKGSWHDHVGTKTGALIMLQIPLFAAP